MATVNTKLIDSLAQIILALSVEEQRLLGHKLRYLGAETQQPSQFELEQFFQTLSTLPPDPEQPSLEAISKVIKEVRRGLWPTEMAYLLRSPKNAKRLLESVVELESGSGQEREMLE